MTEVNPQPSKENETRKPALEHWCRDTEYIKSRIEGLKVAIDGRFLIRLSKSFHCEIQ